MRTALVLLSLAACGKPSSRESERTAPPPAVKPLPSDLVPTAAKKIEARQHAIKAWHEVNADGSDACAAAPAPPPLVVNGFRTGTTKAAKTMVIVTAAAIEGKPDPSLPPDIAADLAKVDAAGRNMGKNGWAELDYTSDAYPFPAGPIAKELQFEIRKHDMGEPTGEPPALLAMLAGAELVLVVERQVRTEVDRTAHSFTPGLLAGTALLYSYDTGAVICAGRFRATNESEKFEGVGEQVAALPDEELQLLAYRDAIANLHAVTAR